LKIVIKTFNACNDYADPYRGGITRINNNWQKKLNKIISVQECDATMMQEDSQPGSQKKATVKRAGQLLGNAVNNCCFNPFQ
jgi:hypothetical protein